MPVAGGARRGAGRPKGALSKRHRTIIDEELLSGLMPLEWMLAVLRDPEAEPSRRDQMAFQAASYCHPRLNAIGLNATGAPAGDTYITQIFAVPRGAALNAKDGVVTIEGAAVSELPAVEPYTGTPALIGPTPVAEPLPVVEVDTKNVTRLDTAKRKRDE